MCHANCKTVAGAWKLSSHTEQRSDVDWHGQHALLHANLETTLPSHHHCTQVGDQLDRGDNEIEILYYLERLQKEAAAAGGALHVLNGNHETMNVDGRFRYATIPGLADFHRWQVVQSIGKGLKVKQIASSLSYLAVIETSQVAAAPLCTCCRNASCIRVPQHASGGWGLNGRGIALRRLASVFDIHWQAAGPVWMRCCG